jgi:hypothetical protein
MLPARSRVVELLLKDPATDVGSPHQRLQTPLHFANHAERAWMWAVTSLLRRGADANARDTDGRTALHVAAAAGDTGSVKVLPENGADVGEIDLEGCSVLLSATHGPNEEMISTLIRAQNAERLPLLKDKNGKGALHHALETWPCCVNVLQALADHKIGLGEADCSGLSPLAIGYLCNARFNYNIGVIKWLLNHGADASAISPNGLKFGALCGKGSYSRSRGPKAAGSSWCQLGCRFRRTYRTPSGKSFGLPR